MSIRVGMQDKVHSCLGY